MAKMKYYNSNMRFIDAAASAYKGGLNTMLRHYGVKPSNVLAEVVDDRFIRIAVVKAVYGKDASLTPDEFKQWAKTIETIARGMTASCYNMTMSIIDKGTYTKQYIVELSIKVPTPEYAPGDSPDDDAQKYESWLEDVYDYIFHLTGYEWYLLDKKRVWPFRYAYDRGEKAWHEAKVFAKVFAGSVRALDKKNKKGK